MELTELFLHSSKRFAVFSRAPLNHASYRFKGRVNAPQIPGCQNGEHYFDWPLSQPLVLSGALRVCSPEPDQGFRVICVGAQDASTSKRLDVGLDLLVS